MPVPLVAVAQGGAPSDFQLRSAFVQNHRQTPLVNGDRPNSFPDNVPSVQSTESSDSHFANVPNHAEILTVGQSQVNPSTDNRLEAKVGGGTEGTAMSTLMQWVGANPIWVPRQEQLRNVPAWVSTSPAPPSVLWTASVIAPDREETTTRKASRTIIVNLSQPSEKVESEAGSSILTSSTQSTQQVDLLTTLTSASVSTNDVDVLTGSADDKQGKKKALKRPLINSSGWMPLVDFG